MRLDPDRRLAILVAARDEAAVRQHDPFGGLDVAAADDVEKRLDRGQDERAIVRFLNCPGPVRRRFSEGGGGQPHDGEQDGVGRITTAV